MFVTKGIALSLLEYPKVFSYLLFLFSYLLFIFLFIIKLFIFYLLFSFGKVTYFFGQPRLVAEEFQFL